MQTWKITSFKRNNGTIYSNTPEKENTFRAGGQVLSILAFICNNEFTIHTIQLIKPAGNIVLGVNHNVRRGNTPAEITKFTPVSDTDCHVTVRYQTGEIDTVNITDILTEAEWQAKQPKKAQPVPAPAPAAPVAAAPGKKNAILEGVQAKILAAYPRPIRLEATMKAKRTAEGLANFMQNFFVKYNEEKATIYADDSTVQTPKKKRRSIGDIFMLCRYYFPEVTLQEVYFQLMKVLPENTPHFRCSYCYTIKKFVWYYDAEKKAAINNTDEKNEYGMDYMEIKKLV